MGPFERWPILHLRRQQSQLSTTCRADGTRVAGVRITGCRLTSASPGDLILRDRDEPMNTRVLGLLMSALLAATSLVGQDQPFTIGVNVSSVTVDAIVQD